MALLMTLMLVMGLTACGSSTAATTTAAPSGTEAATTTAATEAAASKSKVDEFFYEYSDNYIGSVRTALEEGLKAASDKFTYQFYDGASDQAKQTQDVETAITRGTDLLVVNIVTTGSDEAAQNIVDAAKEKDIPVIFFNREVSDAVVNSYEKCCFVGTDADRKSVV